jgi:hypothetical protein
MTVSKWPHLPLCTFMRILIRTNRTNADTLYNALNRAADLNQPNADHSPTIGFRTVETLSSSAIRREMKAIVALSQRASNPPSSTRRRATKRSTAVPQTGRSERPDTS